MLLRRDRYQREIRLYYVEKSFTAEVEAEEKEQIQDKHSSEGAADESPKPRHPPVVDGDDDDDDGLEVSGSEANESESEEEKCDGRGKGKGRANNRAATKAKNQSIEEEIAMEAYSCLQVRLSNFP